MVFHGKPQEQSFRLGGSYEFHFFPSSSPAVLEENWDRNVKCFDKSNFSLTFAFDVGWPGLTNQHVVLLHGFAVDCFLGADTILEPRLRIGLNHESSKLGWHNVASIFANVDIWQRLQSELAWHFAGFFASSDCWPRFRSML